MRQCMTIWRMSLKVPSLRQSVCGAADRRRSAVMFHPQMGDRWLQERWTGSRCPLMTVCSSRAPARSPAWIPVS